MGQTTFSGPVKSDNGFIENSFTTAERDAIQDPVVGLLIFNTETNSYEVFGNSGFQPAFGPPPPPPVVVPVPLTATPNHGSTAGGTTVVIAGSGFTGTTAVGLRIVGFVNFPAASFTVDSDTQITMVTAPDTYVPAAFDVYVTNPAGTGVITGGYTYQPPAPPVFSIANTATGFNNVLTVTPDGLHIYGKSGGTNINSATLGAPFDVTSTTVGMPISLPFDMMNNPTANIAFNGDGTKLITIVNNAGFFPAYYPLATPYNPATINGPIVISPNEINGMGGSGLFFADGGMKAYLTYSNTGYQWNLDSPYDLASFSGNSDKAFNFGAVFTIGMSNMQQFTLNANGTLGYMGVLGSGVSGTMIQFSLGTPFDISTVASTPVELLQLNAGYGGYNGALLNSAGNRLLLSGPDGNGNPTFFQLNGA